MARKAVRVTAYIGIYPTKGTRAKSFESLLQMKVRGRRSELKNRSRIDSWTVRASKPLALVHTIHPLRLEFFQHGTAAYDRAMKAVSWDLDLAAEPDVLAAFEGPLERTQLAVGMLTRHGKDLHISSVLIIPLYPTGVTRTTRAG